MDAIWTTKNKVNFELEVSPKQANKKIDNYFTFSDFLYLVCLGFFFLMKWKINMFCILQGFFFLKM